MLSTTEHAPWVSRGKTKKRKTEGILTYCYKNITQQFCDYKMLLNPCTSICTISGLARGAVAAVAPQD